MKRVFLTFAAATVVFGAAEASITGVVAQGNILPTGPGVGYLPNFFSDTALVIHGWNEAQNYTLTSGLAVDITAPGGYGTALTPGTIVAGTTISSHAFYFDPVATGGAQATFAFDGTIIGVIVLDDDAGIDKFVDSDYLIPASVPVGNIPAGHFAARGLELASGDSLTVSGNHLSLSLNANSPGDQVRVITAAVPEPSTMAALGIAAAIATRRRRK